MKLRNKKTGEIGDLMGTERSCPYITIGVDFHDGNPKEYCYSSLTELNEEWEDVKEPLIKDEKIRKAVRAWAEANCDTKLYYNRPTIELCINNKAGYVIRSIKFRAEFRKAIDIESGYYTITELCGE